MSIQRHESPRPSRALEAAVDQNTFPFPRGPAQPDLWPRADDLQKVTIDTDRLTVSDSLVLGTSRILETSTQKSAAIQLWRCDALGVTGLDIFTNGRCDTSASFLQKYFAVAKRRTEFDRIYSRTFCNIEQHETRKTPDILGTLTSGDLWSADCGTCTWYFNSISSNKYSSSLSLKRHVSRAYENH